MKFPDFFPNGALAPLASARRSAIGLHLADEQAHLVQFSLGSKGLVVRAAASETYPVARDQFLQQPRQVAAWLKRVLKDNNFSGRRVVSCHPMEDLQLFLVSVDVAQGQTHEQALVANLRARLQGEMDRSVVDFLPIRAPDDNESTEREALVAVAPRDSVLVYLQLLERAGLDPVAVEVSPAALARLLSVINADTQAETYANALTVNFGRQNSHVSVIWGRRLVLDRAIAFGEAALLKRLARVLDLSEEEARRLLLARGLASTATAPTGNAAAPPDASPPGASPPIVNRENVDASVTRKTGSPADAGEFAHTLTQILRPELSLLVDEINRTLIYTASRSRGRSIDQIYLLGSVARYPGFDVMLQQWIAVPVTVLDPFKTFSTTLGEAQIACLAPNAGICVASGLALRGLRENARV